ncbi:MAG: hypothetical protein IJ062_04590 [Firmicutes bacterium]|nr:hypothetical protein [Bacillota bacterium]
MCRNRIGTPKQRINAGKPYSAFDTAHALKGMYANIFITPVLTPISEITELLRARTQTDYSALLTEAKTQKAKLDALAK